MVGRIDLKVANSVDSLWYVENFSNGVPTFSAYCMLHKNGFWWLYANNGTHSTVAKLGPATPSEDLFQRWVEYARQLFYYSEN